MECPARVAPREPGRYRFVSRIGAADTEKEGEVSVAGTTRSEPDAAWRRAPPHALRDGSRRAPRGVRALERCHHIALRALPSRYRLRRYTRQTDICGASRLDPSRGARILGQAPRLMPAPGRPNRHG